MDALRLEGIHSLPAGFCGGFSAGFAAGSAAFLAASFAGLPVPALGSPLLSGVPEAFLSKYCTINEILRFEGSSGSAGLRNR